VGKPVILQASTALDRAQRAAAALRDAGLRPGDRLVLLTHGSADYVAVVMGAVQTGVVPVPLDPTLTPAERAPLLADADPAMVVDAPGRLHELVSGRAGAVELADVPLVRPMHYTSGTTGQPKGVASGLLDEGSARALFDDERDFWQIDAHDRHIVASPLHHSAPLRFSITTLLSGGSLVLPGPFDAAVWAASVAEHRPTTGFVVPAHLTRLLEHGMPDMGSVRLLAHAGAACPEPLKRATIEAVGETTVWEFYGSTEGQFTACRADEWLERPGTVGRARPGRELSLDDDGHLWCRVPGFARFEYWRDPERTASAWRGDAFTVGDLGRIDAQGYVYLDGRREDLVISGGVNVYPAEVESALCELDGVREAAVFGVPDERWGQRVCAAIVGDVDEAALVAWARQRLAPAKRPKQLLRVSSLPRTTTGKVRRLELSRALGLDEGM
jgi:acyl-CoA synthetase (AMP-forming)/AMP-acid ligase II